MIFGTSGVIWGNFGTFWGFSDNLKSRDTSASKKWNMHSAKIISVWWKGAEVLQTGLHVFVCATELWTFFVICTEQLSIKQTHPIFYKQLNSGIGQVIQNLYYKYDKKDSNNSNHSTALIVPYHLFLKMKRRHSQSHHSQHSNLF